MNADIEIIRSMFGDGFAQQFFIWTTSLGVASFIHSGRVKKELREISKSLDLFGENLAKEIRIQSERIEKLEHRVNNIEKKG